MSVRVILKKMFEMSAPDPSQLHLTISAAAEQRKADGLGTLHNCATRDCAGSQIPYVASKMDNSRWLVHLNADDWVKMMREYGENG